ncbi:MAG: N-6 DNA methylase [Candidatus Caldarchaeum sp.]
MERVNSLQAINHFKKKEKVFGQFWTPKEVVDFILDFILLNRDKRENAIDPACGDGAFLEGLIERKFKNVVGIDVDASVIASIPAHVKNKVKIINTDGLLFEEKNKFDVVVSNPPFSAKYGRIQNTDILSLFELGENTKSQAIEILFLEKFIRLASEDGIIGVILPFGIISNNNLKKIREFLLKRTKILCIISLPRYIFNGNTSTSSKTCILFLQKKKLNTKYKIFMSITNKLGELKEVLELFKKKHSKGRLAFWTEIEDDNLTPEYYNPEYFETIKELFNSKFKVEKLKSLINEIFCGRTEYGSKRIFSSKGIPFISAKTVTNLGIDFSKERKFVSRSTPMFKEKSLVRKEDLLFVRVGVGCIGRTAVVTSEDECGVVDDWIYIIRPNELLSPYYLSFYLQSRFGKIQLERIKRGVGTVTIPQSSLREIFIPIFSEQKTFKELYLKMRKAYKERKIDKAMGFHNEAVNIIEKAIKG